MGVVPEYTRRAIRGYQDKLTRKTTTFLEHEDADLLAAIEADMKADEGYSYQGLVKRLLCQHFGIENNQSE